MHLFGALKVLLTLSLMYYSEITKIQLIYGENAILDHQLSLNSFKVKSPGKNEFLLSFPLQSYENPIQFPKKTLMETFMF